jgi:Uma2 family endonuclease
MRPKWGGFDVAASDELAGLPTPPSSHIFHGMGVPFVERAHVQWNYDDLRLMPDDGQRYEVIDGDLLVTPAPTTTHQAISKRIQFVLMQQVEQRGLGQVFNAPIDVIFSRTRTVQPDLLVVRTEHAHLITERGVEVAPDLVVEILSASTEHSDRERKAKLYASEGVREYWIVDAAASCIEVYRLGEAGYVLAGKYGPSQRVVSHVFEVDLSVDQVLARR